MWTPGPFEAKPTRSYYYVTDADPSWPAERQAEHLRDFASATLWSISMHEAYPGHFVHALHLRQVESKLRKSLLFSPASAVEGWAHYCEQMMIEAGFEKGNPEVRLGQLAEALIRLARFIVGIRLHAEDMSVEAGMRFFRDEAFMEEAGARREAERGTFDPDLPGLQRGQADAAQAAGRLQGAAGEQVLAAGVPRHLPRPTARSRSGRSAS